MGHRYEKYEPVRGPELKLRTQESERGGGGAKRSNSSLVHTQPLPAFSLLFPV
jgi:hypothetical protein